MARQAKAAPRTRGARKTPRIVKLGIVGLGPRGETLVAAMREMPDVEIVAICDVNPERVGKTISILKRDGKPLPRTYADYHDLVADGEVEGVLVPTS